MFETNSSSVHSVTMCSQSDYDRWKKGELILNLWSEELVEITDKIKLSIDNHEREYFTYDEFFDYVCAYYETYVKSYTTEKGEEIVAFGYYGHDWL